MLPTTKTASIILLLVITSVASGQEPQSPTGYPRWAEYRQSPDLPNGIAFDALRSRINHINTEFGPADAAEWVEYNLGVDNIQAHAFVSPALTTRYFIDTDAHESTKRLACEYTGPDVDRADQYTALQKMYDINKAISDHYYEQTKANLDAETAERLQQWTDKRKLRMGYVEIDFEKASQVSGNDPAVTLSGICERDS